jgi:hypothetical protein
MFVSAFDVEQFPIGEVRQYTGEGMSASLADMPYYDLVPKELIPQLRWRLYVRARGMVDAEFREAINQAAAEDVLFFANTLGYVEEPRPVSRELPMNTWPDQDEALAAMEECFGVREFCAEKSRGVGFSYILVTLFLQKWKWQSRVRLGLVSRDEDSVDKKGDDDTLMAKLDFMFSWLPQWMRCLDDGRGPTILDRTYTNHRFYNIENQASIFGYAATGDVMTGGRKTAIGLDEFGKFKKKEDAQALASTQHVTNCRFFVSTYKGNSNEFYKLANTPSPMLKYISDWKTNPERSRGLYTSENGELLILDKGFQYPLDYEFILDGKIRSVWYDYEWRRPGATPQSIAEELDRNPRGSVSKVFCDEFFHVQRQFVGPPLHIGSLIYDEHGTPDKFVAKSNGSFSLWMPISSDGRPGYPGPFIISCDISAGTGQSSSSNSSLEIIDSRRREQVGEIISNRIRPHAFALLAMAVARWLNQNRSDQNTIITFENNGGPGSDFDKTLKQLGYANIYRDRNSKGKNRQNGYRKPDDGSEIFLNLEGVGLDKQVRIRSDMVLRELDQYEYRNGRIIHVTSSDGDDESAKGKPHGDCAIAFAIGAMLLSVGVIAGRQPEPERPPPGSVGAQYEALRQLQANSRDGIWWDDASGLPSSPYAWN